MAITKTIMDNEEELKDAITSGISGEAVNSTLEDVVNKTDEMGKNPQQLKEVVETIVNMKDDVPNVKDESYASNFVKENADRINAALQDGITPNEITNTLVEKTNNNEKKPLKFIVRLISKMKKKELRLKKDKENQKGYQKVLVKK